MCGIFSIFSKKDSISSDTIQKAINQLEHRGPDDQGIWISNNKKIGLAHKRLSIIDLDNGKQPISNADNSLQIVANGEFYDFENIREELELSGCKFKTKSDSEIALHLYERYGSQCLERLRGEFAFSIWDENNQRLFAARDRFGIKPLYYCIHNDIVYLSSEVKALFAAGVPAEWDYESFQQFTSFLVTFPTRTLYRNIYQVPPGHYMLATENDFKILPYWDFNYDKNTTSNNKLSDTDYIEQFKHEFHEAVRLRLRADVPVGCYLSGGVDSSAIAATAKLYSSKPITLFTLAFEQEEYNELSIAEKMANHLDMDINSVPVTQTQLADNFANAVWHNEAPFINTHAVAKYILSRAVQSAGIKTVLTGEGADEICAGYMPFRSDMVLYGSDDLSLDEKNILLEELNNGNKLTGGVFVSHGVTESFQRVNNILGFTPSFFESFSGNAVKFKNLLSNDYREFCKSKNIYSMFLDELHITPKIKNWHVLDKSLYLWNKSLLPNYNLSALGDRMEMANSIEGRVPFLDHHLVEAVNTMPATIKIRGVTEKYILREAMRDVLPKSIYARQKFAFKAPPATIVSNDKSYILLQDTLRSSEMQSLPFFDHKKVIRVLDKLPDMDENSKIAIDAILTSLMSLCVLSSKFNL